MYSLDILAPIDSTSVLSIFLAGWLAGWHKPITALRCFPPTPLLILAPLIPNHFPLILPITGLTITILYIYGKHISLGFVGMIMVFWFIFFGLQESDMR